MAKTSKSIKPGKRWSSIWCARCAGWGEKKDFQDNRYNPEQLFFEISSYNNLKRKIINELTWKEELVFTMREQNFTIEEISQVTDNCIKTVYNIINRIKKKVSNLCKIS